MWIETILKQKLKALTNLTVPLFLKVRVRIFHIKISHLQSFFYTRTISGLNALLTTFVKYVKDFWQILHKYVIRTTDRKEDWKKKQDGWKNRFMNGSIKLLAGRIGN